MSTAEIAHAAMPGRPRLRTAPTMRLPVRRDVEGVAAAGRLRTSMSSTTPAAAGGGIGVADAPLAAGRRLDDAPAWSRPRRACRRLPAHRSGCGRRSGDASDAGWLSGHRARSSSPSDQFADLVGSDGQGDLARAAGVPAASASAKFLACSNLIFGGIGGSCGSTTASISDRALARQRLAQGRRRSRAGSSMV